ncbi:MAG: CrcB family protein [Planctomycetota bacterium]
MHAMIWVFLGGGLGAVGRYGAAIALARPALPRPGSSQARDLTTLDLIPLSTLAVNVAGCLLIGVLVPMLAGRPEPWKAALIVGVLGGFTTFSAFGYETLALVQHGRPLLALVYVIGSVLLGVGAVWLGHTLAHASGLASTLDAAMGDAAMGGSPGEAA